MWWPFKFVGGACPVQGTSLVMFILLCIGTVAVFGGNQKLDFLTNYISCITKQQSYGGVGGVEWREGGVNYLIIQSFREQVHG